MGKKQDEQIAPPSLIFKCVRLSLCKSVAALAKMTNPLEYVLCISKSNQKDDCAPVRREAGCGGEKSLGRFPCPWGAASVWVLPEADPKKLLDANNLPGR